jgi:hypothetical protein
VGIRVTKTPNFRKIIKTLSATDEEVISVATLFIGGGNFGIQQRTQQGRDADKRSFKPYNKQYKHYRNTKGRGSKVNLTFHNQMLHGMRVKKYRGGAMIYFKGKENDKAYYNHEVLGRKFFALDDDQVNYMHKRIGTFIAKGLK